MSIRKIISLYLAGMMVMLQTGVICPALANEQQDCEQRLTSAEELYYSGAFDEAIELAKGCLRDSDISSEFRGRIYTLLAKAFMAKGETETARKLIENVLKVNPDYHPTIEQETPRYVNLVEDVRGQIQPPGSSSESKKWWWIGGGTAVVGLVTLLIFSGGDNPPQTPQSLPEPPSYPDN